MEVVDLSSVSQTYEAYSFCGSPISATDWVGTIFIVTLQSPFGSAHFLSAANGPAFVFFMHDGLLAFLWCACSRSITVT